MTCYECEFWTKSCHPGTISIPFGCSQGIPLDKGDGESGEPVDAPPVQVGSTAPAPSDIKTGEEMEVDIVGGLPSEDAKFGPLFGG